jgi:hypothetical protein
MQEVHKGQHNSPNTEFKKGFKHSDEWKKIISEKLRGRISPNKGKKSSKEHVEKIANANRGKKHPHSEETKKYLSELSKKQFENGMSIETRLKISKSIKGKTSGEKHYNWKGGVSNIKDRLKHTLEYSNWRFKIYNRDNFTCQNCGAIGGKLNCHHIKAFAKIIIEYDIKSFEDALICQELWDINNGITLCEECHKKTDNYLKNKVN